MAPRIEEMDPQLHQAQEDLNIEGRVPCHILLETTIQRMNPQVASHLHPVHMFLQVDLLPTPQLKIIHSEADFYGLENTIHPIKKTSIFPKMSKEQKQLRKTHLLMKQTSRIKRMLIIL